MYLQFMLKNPKPFAGRLACFVLAIAWTLSSPPAQAQRPNADPTPSPAATLEDKKPDILRVGINAFWPLVFLDEKEPRGYSVDLWKKIAGELKIPFEFVSFAGVGDKLNALAEGQIHVAVGGVTVTAKRERIFDFTHPTLEAGLSILVRDDTSIDLGERLKRIFTKTRVSILAGFLLLIVVAGHLMWWAERGRESFSDKYAQGVSEGMYWALVTASTVGYGDKVPSKQKGRLLAMVVIVFSLPLFALFTAELTSAMTLQEIQSSPIRSPRDLLHHRVGVIRTTEGATWGRRRDLELRQYEDIKDAYQGLLNREVDALVYDAPTLLYLSQNEGSGKVHVVGEPFVRQGLGIAVPDGDALRERINRALLDLEESGELAQISAKWFG